MSSRIEDFGSYNGKPMKRYVLENASGSRCSLISYGGAIQELIVPDRDGKMADVTLGFDDLDGYTGMMNPYFGALVGRHGNRIEDACFTLDGKTYQLAKNNGRNHLHGGLGGFSRVVWDAKVVSDGDEPAVCFTLFSPDGEEGYPGNLNTSVTYTLTSDNALRLDYDAVSDKKTVINLTNHAYFNLAGHDKGMILDHVMRIDADETTLGNEELLPDGTFGDVTGTAFDFREAKPLGRDIENDEEQLHFGGGYDHNWVLRPPMNVLKKCAEVYEPISGRVMTVETTLPGVQLYTSNMMGPVTGKEGAKYDKRHGFCLETQYHPNSLKHPHFPQPVFDAGEHFKHTTVYGFGVKK